MSILHRAKMRTFFTLCAILFALSHATPTSSAPLAGHSLRPVTDTSAASLMQDAPATAIDSVASAIERAAAEVSGVLSAEPFAGEDLSVEEDPDWQRFSAGEAEIWLPASFVGGDLQQDLDLIIERVRALGPEFAAMVETIEQNPSAFLLFAVDTEGVDAGVVTNVNLLTERVLSFVDTELYLESVAGQLPEQFELRDQEPITLSEFEDGRRALISVEFPGAPPMMQAMYVIKDDTNTIWVVTFTAHASELDIWLPIFDRSVESFSLVQD